MIGTPFLLLLLLIASGIGAVALRQGHAGFAGLSLGIAFILLTSWIRFAGVMAAGRHFRSGRRDAAWNELRRVPLRGRLLAGSHRAYFHLLRAAIQIDRAEWDGVIADCDAVLALGRTKAANTSTAHGAKSKALLMLGRRDEARENLRLARSLPHKPRLDNLLASVEKGLAESEG